MIVLKIVHFLYVLTYIENNTVFWILQYGVNEISGKCAIYSQSILRIEYSG
jgi:hypothetical protein